VPGLLLRVQQVALLPMLAVPLLDCLLVRASPAQVAQDWLGARYVYQRSCTPSPRCSCSLCAVACCMRRTCSRGNGPRAHLRTRLFLVLVASAAQGATGLLCLPKPAPVGRAGAQRASDPAAAQRRPWSPSRATWSARRSSAAACACTTRRWSAASRWRCTLACPGATRARLTRCCRWPLAHHASWSKTVCGIASPFMCVIVRTGSIRLAAHRYAVGASLGLGQTRQRAQGRVRRAARRAR